MDNNGQEPEDKKSKWLTAGTRGAWFGFLGDVASLNLPCVLQEVAISIVYHDPYPEEVE